MRYLTIALILICVSFAQSQIVTEDRLEIYVATAISGVSVPSLIDTLLWNAKMDSVRVNSLRGADSVRAVAREGVKDSSTYCTQTMIKGMLSRYNTILQAQGYLIATKVAGTYIIGTADSCQKSGNTHLMPMAIVNILAADFPTVNGIAPELRVSAIVSVNNTAPSANFTIGLYPVTSGAGGAALKIYSVGSLVTSSATTTVTTPAGSSMTAVSGSDIALPADGVYCLAVVTNATIATSSLVHINAKLQVHNQ